MWKRTLEEKTVLQTPAGVVEQMQMHAAVTEQRQMYAAVVEQRWSLSQLA